MRKIIGYAFLSRYITAFVHQMLIDVSSKEIDDGYLLADIVLKDDCLLQNYKNGLKRYFSERQIEFIIETFKHKELFTSDTILGTIMHPVHLNWSWLLSYQEALEIVEKMEEDKQCPALHYKNANESNDKYVSDMQKAVIIQEEFDDEVETMLNRLFSDENINKSEHERAEQQLQTAMCDFPSLEEKFKQYMELCDSLYDEKHLADFLAQINHAFFDTEDVRLKAAILMDLF